MKGSWLSKLDIHFATGSATTNWAIHEFCKYLHITGRDEDAQCNARLSSPTDSWRRKLEIRRAHDKEFPVWIQTYSWKADSEKNLSHFKLNKAKSVMLVAAWKRLWLGITLNQASPCLSPTDTVSSLKCTAKTQGFNFVVQDLFNYLVIDLIVQGTRIYFLLD